MNPTIRPETPADRDAIHEVVALAFGREDEAELVEALRQSAAFIPELSLVTAQDGNVIGHVMFSHMSIETPTGTAPALALAPVSVRPEQQNRGIGSRLVREGLERCQALGHRIVIVEGHPAYYPRFGFLPARAQGLEATFPVPDAAFMALELVPGALDGVRGTVRYPPAFGPPYSD